MPTPQQQAVPRRYRPKAAARSIALVKFPDSYVVSQTEDEWGFWRLTCDCPSFKKTKPREADMCVHFDRAMKEHFDIASPAVQGRNNDVEFLLGQHNGALLDQWAQVTASRKPAVIGNFHVGEADSFGFRRVVLCRKDNFNANDSMWVPEYHVGLITQHDGRYEVRQLLLEWLMEQVGMETCRAAHHRTSYYEKLESNLSPKGLPNLLVLADVLDIAVTGRCRLCNEDDGVPDVDI